MVSKTRAIVVAAGAVVAIAAPTSASAEAIVGGTQSNGVGFCIRGIAVDPSEIGVRHFGVVASGTATSSAGAVPVALDDIRYPVCGGPGSGE